MADGGQFVLVTCLKTVHNCAIPFGDADAAEVISPLTEHASTSTVDLRSQISVVETLRWQTAVWFAFSSK